MPEDLMLHFHTQLSALERKLAEHGWGIANRLTGESWWHLATWTIESVWSPRGFRWLLTFVQPPSAGSGVADDLIIVVESEKPPEGWGEGDEGSRLWLTKGWRDRLPNFLHRLDQHRSP